MQDKSIYTIALSCSLVWHLLGVQAVHIIWPQQLMPQKFAAINFWGTILENTDFNAAGGPSENLQPAENAKGKQIALNQDKTEVPDSGFDIMEKKPLPLTELSEKDAPKVLVDIPLKEQFLLAVKMEEEFKRSVFFKPDLPAYPEWAKKLGNYFEVQLKFLILPDGTVANVEKITSSGYPELDEIGVRYIRKWKFMSLPAQADQKEQWGVIKLVFKLR